MIRVIVIEDEPLMREALELDVKRSLGLHFVGSAGNFEDAELSLKFGMDCDVVVLDFHLPGLDGAEATRALKRFPRLKVLILSFDENPERIKDAFEAGADGYLVKSAPREELAAAIVKVYRGDGAVSQKVANAMISFFQKRQPLLLHLSPTEKRVMELLDSGRSYKQVAEDLGISLETVKSHVRRILEKSRAVSITQASWLRKQLL